MIFTCVSTLNRSAISIYINNVSVNSIELNYERSSVSAHSTLLSTCVVWVTTTTTTTSIIYIYIYISKTPLFHRLYPHTRNKTHIHVCSHTCGVRTVTIKRRASSINSRHDLMLCACALRGVWLHMCEWCMINRAFAVVWCVCVWSPRRRSIINFASMESGTPRDRVEWVTMSTSDVRVAWRIVSYVCLISMCKTKHLWPHK